LGTFLYTRTTHGTAAARVEELARRQRDPVHEEGGGGENGGEFGGLLRALHAIALYCLGWLLEFA